MKPYSKKCIAITHGHASTVSIFFFPFLIKNSDPEAETGFVWHWGSFSCHCLFCHPTIPATQEGGAWCNLSKQNIMDFSCISDVTEVEVEGRPLQLGNSNYPKTSCSLPCMGAPVNSGQNVDLSWNFTALILFWSSTGFDWLSIEMLNCNCFV